LVGEEAVAFFVFMSDMWYDKHTVSVVLPWLVLVMVAEWLAGWLTDW
jgi:hypothetical protein